MPQGPTLMVDGKRTTIHYFTGKVLSSQKQKETKIHSNTSYVGQNNQAVTSVSSTTVDHHEFFLADSAGTERAFKTIDFDIPCREGNTMTVMWAVPEDSKEGPYIELRNHNTGEHTTVEPKRVASYWRKPWWMIWGSMLGVFIVLTVIINFFIGAIALFVPFFYFRWRANNAVKTMFGSNEFRQLDSQVAQVKPLAA